MRNGQEKETHRPTLLLLLPILFSQVLFLLLILPSKVSRVQITCLFLNKGLCHFAGYDAVAIFILSFVLYPLSFILYTLDLTFLKKVAALQSSLRLWFLILILWKLSHSVVSDSLRPHGVHGIFQARVLEGCHFLLQRIFPTQGSNLGYLKIKHSQIRNWHTVLL